MWHPHSESWGQWPIQQSAYANVPAEQVDWGALAQQWIAHKEHAVHLPVGHGVSEVGAHGHGPPYAPWGWNSAPTAPHSADWNNSGGHSSSWHPSGPTASANPDVPVPPPVPQYVDYGHGNYEVQSFDYNHGGVTSTLPASTSWDYQSSSGSATSHSVWPPEPASQPPLPPPPPPPEEVVETTSPSLILMPDSTVESSVAVDVSENASHRTHQHHHHHHRRQSQHVVPHVPVSDADDSSMISDAKRKILPSWIREGLEKMEREKMKKLEREKQEKEREEKEKLRAAAEKAASEAQHSEQSGEPTLPRKSRFDMDGDTTRQEKPAIPVTEGSAYHSSESVQTHAVSSAAASKPVISSSNVSNYRDTAPVTTITSGTAVAAAQPEAATEMSAENSSEEDDQQSLSAEERQRRLIEKVKEMLTTVLKDVTDEQIRIIAKETYVKCRQRASKAPAKQLAKSSALASLTMFGAGDDSDDSDSGGERKRKSADDSSDSDEEDVEYRLRKKKAEFHKAQRERLLRLEREEQLARDASENIAVKEEQSSEKKADGSRGRDDAKVPDDNNQPLQQGSRQSPAHGHSAASSSDKIGHADVRGGQHERHESETSPDGTVQHKYDRHKGEKGSELTGKSDHGDAAYGRRGSDDLDKKTARRAASQLSTSPDRVRSEPSKSHGSSAAAREERCRGSKSPVTKGSKQGASSSSPETAVSSFRSSVPSKDKEAKKHADGSTVSQKVSARERDSTADSDASSNSDSDSSNSSSSRSGDDRQQSAKKRANVEERDRSPDRRRERERRRERSTSGGVKRSGDTKRDSRKSRDRDKRRSHKKHSRRSSSRDSSDRFSGRRRRDKKDDYRRSSRSPSRKSRRSRSPAVVRKSSGKRRDRSEDRSSKRRRRDASTSGSEERGGKKASHKTSRTRRRSRS